MNYLEIAEAYDKYADALVSLKTDVKSNDGVVELVLQLREKAEGCRASWRREDRAAHLQETDKARLKMRDEFDMDMRRQSMALGESEVRAKERQVQALESIAKALFAQAEQAAALTLAIRAAREQQ